MVCTSRGKVIALQHAIKIIFSGDEDDDYLMIFVYLVNIQSQKGTDASIVTRKMTCALLLK